MGDIREGLASAPQLLGRSLMKVELGVKERIECADVVGLGVLDVLHPAENVLG